MPFRDTSALLTPFPWGERAFFAEGGERGFPFLSLRFMERFLLLYHYIFQCCYIDDFLFYSCFYGGILTVILLYVLLLLKRGFCFFFFTTTFMEGFLLSYYDISYFYYNEDSLFYSCFLWKDSYYRISVYFTTVTARIHCFIPTFKGGFLLLNDQMLCYYYS